MDVGDSLRNLGFGQYEAAFRENEIDAEVPAHLTDAALSLDTVHDSPVEKDSR